MRRSAFVTLAISTVVSASCGRQVTPSPSAGNSNLAGKMLVRFQTQGPLDFTNYNYLVVFNVYPSPNNSTNMPYANAFNTGTFANFTYAFAIGASYGGLAALPTLLQYYISAGNTNLSVRQIATTPSLTSFTPNSNGSGTAFTLIFARDQLNQPSPYTPSPGPSATPTPTVSPTASPAPSGTPTPVAPTPAPTSTQYFSNTWYINFFTANRQGIAVDALGFGVNDNTFVFSTDITTQTQNLITRPGGVPSVPQSAAIAGGEIDNYP